MQVNRAPRKRCAVCVKDGVQIMFLVLPKRVEPLIPVEPEPLMFFDNTPTTKVEDSNKGDVNLWVNGQFVISLIINSRGDLCRCPLFQKEEFTCLRDVYRKCGPFESTVEYPAVFGCILLDKVYFLVASKVEQAATLPFGRAILRVLETEWVPFVIPDSAPLRMTSPDRNRLREFQQYKHGKGYFYSDDCDLTRPFPFLTGEDGPDFQCDWSEHLRQSFCLHNNSEGCSLLIRGFADEKIVSLRDGSTLHVLLIGRQSHLNPGPRYLGRGLNVSNAAGNDHVYEYIIWREINNNAISFARHFLLRGTIPVRWSTRINATIGEPSMVFNSNKEDVLRGCDTYFEGVFRQLGSLIRYDAVGNVPGVDPKLRCINLLRQNPQSGEEILARYFIEAVRKSTIAVRRLFFNAQLDLVHVDWLNLVKDYGIDVATETFWDASVSFLSNNGEEPLATVGCMYADGSVKRTVCQSRFVRVNCADSLDRTNLGCFFTCVQASIFMLQSLGVRLDSFSDQRPLPTLTGQEDVVGDNFFSCSVPMTGMKSARPKPYVSSWCEVRNPNLYPVAICRVLAELYVYNGDVVAQLYTSSAAMHSNTLRGICGLRSSASNMVIATQRRFQNVFEDRKKLRSIELLLGRNKRIHFPSMSQAFLTRPVPLANWSCALIAVGVPPGVQASVLDLAVRKAWDEMVLPTFHSEGIPSFPSSALCFEVSLPEDEVQARQEFASTVLQLMSEEALPTEEETNVPPENEQIGVIEFDSDLCSACDIPKFLRERSVLNVLGSNVILVPYFYPVKDSDMDSSGIVQKAVNSLRSGIKSFVRGLKQ